MCGVLDLFRICDELLTTIEPNLEGSISKLKVGVLLE